MLLAYHWKKVWHADRPVQSNNNKYTMERSDGDVSYLVIKLTWLNEWVDVENKRKYWWRQTYFWLEQLVNSKLEKLKD